MHFLAALVESSSDAIYGKNLEGIIVSWNPAAERLFGYSTEDIVGQSTAVLYPQARRKEMAEILERVRAGATVAEMETCVSRHSAVTFTQSICPDCAKSYEKRFGPKSD